MTPARSGFADGVDRLAAAGDAAGLVDLLREDHPAYAGVPAARVAAYRGWVLLALARVGVPPAAVRYLHEELESGHDPYLVAAAAVALRRLPPSPTHGRLLVAALWAFAGGDAPVGLARFDDDGSADEGTSVVAELIETLAAQGPPARPCPTCSRSWHPRRHSTRPHARRSGGSALRAAPAGGCCDPPPPPEPGPATDPADLAAVRFEDQDSQLLGFGDLTGGRPTVVAFFDTRCDNPRKCSLTIAKLARVQQLLAADPAGTPVGLVAITYDPAFDTPARLRA